MDLSTYILFGVVLLLGLNQVVMRVPALQRRPAVFFGLLTVEILTGSALLVFGLPGFENVPAARWVIGLLFFGHAAQNLGVRGRLAREEGKRVADARRAKVQAVVDGMDDSAD